MSRISVGCVVAAPCGVPEGQGAAAHFRSSAPGSRRRRGRLTPEGGGVPARPATSPRAANGDCLSLSGGTSCSNNFLLWREEAGVPPEPAAAVTARLRASASPWPERWRQGPAEPARWVAAPAFAASGRMRARVGRAGGRSLGGATPASRGLLGR